VTFSVWAPNAKSVELILATGRVALQRIENGYWRTEIAGTDMTAGYRYSIDGSDPLPDPRSRWQPEGVHAASYPAAGVDRNQTARGEAGFRAKPLEQGILYELHIGTFTDEGTYAAAREKLGYLVELGVTHLELMPLATFPGRRGWGYDGVDLFAPFPAYGMPQELVAFVADCHSHGLAVLLDVVYNHLGPDGNYLGQFAPYFTDRYKTGWGSAINYDGPHSDGVRRFIIDNALMWLRDYGFDGLRLDAVHAMFSFEASHVLEELAIAVKGLAAELDRPLTLIAESDLNDPRLVRDISRGGYGLDAHWVDDFHHALHRYFTGEIDGYYADFSGLRDVATALRDGYVYQGQYSSHRKRRHGRPPSGLAASQLVVSAQNHDQIGNRAQGERLSMMLNLPQLKAVAALTLLSPFVPLLFQGEEWGAMTPFLYFTDHESAELGRLVAEGRAEEFRAFQWQGTVPNPQDFETFTRSKLNWSEPSRPVHAELLDWYRRLIRLRSDKVVHQKESPLNSAKAVVEFNAEAEWLHFCHHGVLAVFNFRNSPQRVPIPAGVWKLLMRSDSLEAESDLVPAQATFVYIGNDLHRPR
jgi:maltooligosyltrehalose trehalohydrolase